MRITATGHAGSYLETASGNVLCDPWRSPAYFASWFPFPDNSEVEFESFEPDFLFVSHLHRDHFDPDVLRRLVKKSVTVLLPEFPIEDLRTELTDLGFRSFVATRSGEPIELDGLRVMITTSVSPADGPLGDSTLSVDDGTVRVLNQNDARPRDLDSILDFGPYDGHLLQFSGAIWWPVVYELAEATKSAVGARKRLNGMARAQRFIETVGARFVFPNSGPACFLDRDLFAFNDFSSGPASGDEQSDNPFPDQTVFLAHLAGNGIHNGRLLIPSSVAELTPAGCVVTHPMAEEDVERIFTDKRSYLEGYAARQAGAVQAERTGRPSYDGDLLDALRDWWDPLLALADKIGPGVGDLVLLEVTGEAGSVERIVIDFVRRQVRAHAGEECRYRFVIARDLVEAQVARHEVDWVNSLFLSLRFRAARKGAYNEFIYTFFKCLSPERLEYAEGWYAEHDEPDELVQIGDYMVQRRCPHLKADLARFGELQDGVLECGMHHWRFDLATGRCLTSDAHKIVAYPVGREPAGVTEQEAQPEGRDH
jgi:UDP-MurNAc hydroxylase